MLVQSQRLVGARILSLHTGQPIGQLGELIINPNTFEVAGFYCEGKWAAQHKEPMVLLAPDIREVAGAGVLIDSHDSISPLDDLIRIKDISAINYKLIDKPVYTESKKRLGKIMDYVINTEGFGIQKIYVKQSLFKSMSMHSLVIDRQQIIEITDKRVVVSDATVTTPAAVPSQAA